MPPLRGGGACAASTQLQAPWQQSPPPATSARLPACLPACPHRVYTIGVFSNTVEWIGEDYMRLEDNGKTIITRQMCKDIPTGNTTGQYLVGRYAGDDDPRKHHHHRH